MKDKIAEVRSDSMCYPRIFPQLTSVFYQIVSERNVHSLLGNCFTEPNSRNNVKEAFERQVSWTVFQIATSPGQLWGILLLSSTIRIKKTRKWRCPCAFVKEGPEKLNSAIDMQILATSKQIDLKSCRLYVSDKRSHLNFLLVSGSDVTCIPLHKNSEKLHPDLPIIQKVLDSSKLLHIDLCFKRFWLKTFNSYRNYAN